MDKVLKIFKSLFGLDLAASLTLCFLFILAVTGLGYLIAPSLATGQAKNKLGKNRGAKEAEVVNFAHKYKSYLPLFLALVGFILTVMLVVGRLL